MNDLFNIKEISLIAIIALSLGISVITYAQENTNTNQEQLVLKEVDKSNVSNKNIPYSLIYITWISLNSETFKVKGILYEIKDSSILVANTVVMADYYIDKLEISEFYIDNIETIKIRKSTRIIKGALIGLITGITVGGISGFASGDDPPCTSCFIDFSRSAKQKAIVRGILSGIGGAVIGLLVGSAKTKISIDGSISNYKTHKDKLREYSLREKL